MKVIKPTFIIESTFDSDSILQHIEKTGRTAYKSENKISDESASNFVHMILNRGHLSVIEHAFITVRIICDRGISHEIFAIDLLVIHRNQRDIVIIHKGNLVMRLQLSNLVSGMKTIRNIKFGWKLWL